MTGQLFIIGSVANILMHLFCTDSQVLGFVILLAAYMIAHSIDQHNEK